MTKNHGNLHIEYFPIEHAILKANPDLLHKLAKFYCSIWMYDPNFGEYRMCPVKECGKYYSEKDVEADGITTCSGTGTTAHPTVDLIPAWESDQVANKELIGNTVKYGKFFYGIYAKDMDSGKIVGFTWGWLEKNQDIKEKWGEEIAQILLNSDSTYYSEIAVDPSEKYRGKRIGKELCSRLTMWLGSAHPDVPSFLRTHKTSYAKKMFEEAGYRYFADDPQHGDGRIMMMVNKGQDLVS